MIRALDLLIALKPKPLIQEKKVLTANDYEITDSEREIDPTLERTIVDNWVIDSKKDSPWGLEYQLSPLGEPRDYRHELMNLSFSTGISQRQKSRGVNELDASWHSQINTRQFIDIANVFLKAEEMLPSYPRSLRLLNSTDGRFDSDPFAPVGISLKPGEREPSFNLPFQESGGGLSYEQLQEALRQRGEYNNFDVDECRIVVTTSSCLLGFTPYVPDDPVRHDYKNRPKAADLELQMIPATMASLIMPILRATSTYNFPWRHISQVLRTEFVERP